MEEGKSHCATAGCRALLEVDAAKCAAASCATLTLMEIRFADCATGGCAAVLLITLIVNPRSSLAGIAGVKLGPESRFHFPTAFNGAAVAADASKVWSRTDRYCVGRRMGRPLDDDVAFGDSASASLISRRSLALSVEYFVEVPFCEALFSWFFFVSAESAFWMISQTRQSCLQFGGLRTEQNILYRPITLDLGRFVFGSIRFKIGFISGLVEISTFLMRTQGDSRRF